VHAADAGGFLSKHSTRDRDAARSFAHSIPAHRQTAKHLEILGMLGGQPLEERKCFRRRLDFEQEVGEMKSLFERFFRLEPINRFVQLDASPLEFAAPEERFGESSANEGHVGVKSAGDLKLDPGLVEPAK
jgi:hypothetical protein